MKKLLIILLSLFLTFSCDIKTDVKIGNKAETYHQIDKVKSHIYEYVRNPTPSGKRDNWIRGNKDTLTYEIDTEIRHIGNSMIMNVSISKLVEDIPLMGFGEKQRNRLKGIQEVKIGDWKTYKMPEKGEDKIEYLFFSSDSFMLFTVERQLFTSLQQKYKNSDGSIDEIWLWSVNLSKELYNEIDYWIINWRYLLVGPPR